MGSFQSEQDGSLEEYMSSLEELARKIEHQLSQEEVFYDPLLLDFVESSKDGWIDITKLLSIVGERIGCGDEVIVQKAIKEYSASIEVSDDNLLIKIALDLQNWKDLNNRSVHIEFPDGIVTQKRIEKIISKVGSPQKVRLVDYGPAHRGKDSYKCVVVTFNSESEAIEISEMYGNSSLQLDKGEDVGFMDSLATPVVLQRTRWLDLFKEYKSLRDSRLSALHSSSKEASGKSVVSHIDAGSLLEFKNVQPRTNYKILKYLFGLFAPVGFVDYKKNSNKGVVRYRTSTGARHAMQFLSHHQIAQKHENDTGTLVRRYASGRNAGTSALPPIAVDFLPDKKVSDYIKSVAISEDAKGGSGINAGAAQKCEPKHIYFDSSDDDE